MYDDLLRDVILVRPRGGHRIFLRFDDAVEGDLDLREYVEFKGIFAPLADPAYVARVRVDPELGTVQWPNGADLDPLVLYCRVRGIPVPTFTDDARA